MITLQEQLDRSTSPQQVAVTLVGTLGGLALLLAVIGLYGVMSYAVSQSTRELGLRMALGAGAPNLLRLVMSRGLALTAGGVLLGAAVALGLTRLLENLLYKVSPRDPLAFGSAFVVMTIASLAACFLPPGAPRASIQSALCGLILGIHYSRTEAGHTCRFIHAIGLPANARWPDTACVRRYLQ